MYINDTLFAIGLMGLQKTAREASYTHTHNTHTIEKVDEEKLARAIVKEQRQQEQEAEEREQRINREMEEAVRSPLRWHQYSHKKEIDKLRHLLLKEKPCLLPHSNLLSKLRIYNSDDNADTFYVKIGSDTIQAIVLQWYMFECNSNHPNTRNFWRENIDGNIYFIIKNEFAEELGWI